MRIQLISIALLAWIGPGAAAAQEAEPFQTRNLAPGLAIFGLPTWQAKIPEPALMAALDIANHYQIGQRDTELLLFDGETMRLNLTYARPLGRRWSVRAELPFVRQSGGMLDNVIDGWHSFFNMPDGGRNNRPENLLLYEIARDGQVGYRLDASGQGIGDLMLGIGRSFGPEERFVARATLKVPTGNEHILASSGSADWSLTLLRAREVTALKRAAGYYWGVGALALGEADPIPYSSKDAAFVGIVGGSLKIFERIGFKVQLDVSSALYDSPLRALGESTAQASLGGWWEIDESSRLEFAINEDVKVGTAPDVALHLGLYWAL